MQRHNANWACAITTAGVAEDEEEAVKWYRKAAEQGYAIAQLKLADCYYHGNGVTKNYAEAVEWYRESAE